MVTLVYQAVSRMRTGRLKLCNRTEAEGAYKVAVKAVDKAAAKGLLHKNNAAHKKSAMTLKLNNIG